MACLASSSTTGSCKTTASIGPPPTHEQHRHACLCALARSAISTCEGWGSGRCVPRASKYRDCTAPPPWPPLPSMFNPPSPSPSPSSPLALPGHPNSPMWIRIMQAPSLSHTVMFSCALPFLTHPTFSEGSNDDPIMHARPLRSHADEAQVRYTRCKEK